MKKPNMLIFVDWFAPAYKAGGIITACRNYAMTVSKDYRIFIITSDSDLNGEPLNGITRNSWELFDQCYFVKYVQKNEMTLSFIQSTVKVLKPDEIQINSMFSLNFSLKILLLRLLKKISARIVLNTHGMMLPEALQIKPLKKKLFLKAFKLTGIHKKILFRSNDENEIRSIKAELHLPSENVALEKLKVDNEVSSPVSCFKEVGHLRIIFLARIQRKKNLDYALSILAGLPYAILLTIVGPVEDIDYWAACEAQIKRLPENIVVRYEGAVPHKQVAAHLQNAHCLFLPSKTENFCYAIYESLCNARPVITSDHSYWRNLETAGAGWDIPLEQPEQFRLIIEKMVLMGPDEFERLAKSSWEHAVRYHDSQLLEKNEEAATTLESSN